MKVPLIHDGVSFFYVASRIACKAFCLCSFKRAFLYHWLLFLFRSLFEQPTQGQWSGCACFNTSLSSNSAFSYSVKRITCAHTHWHPHTPTHSLGGFDSKCRQLKAVRATLSLSVSSLFFPFSSFPHSSTRPTLVCQACCWIIQALENPPYIFAFSVPCLVLVANNGRLLCSST